MRINFRQGLVRVPTNFLSFSGGFVSLVIPAAETLVATFADGINDYLITERSSISPSTWGPFTAGTDYWLYFDINPSTGQRTFGYTLYEPVETAQPPLTPLTGQCWFDTSTTTFKVWSGASWVRKIRVFAAKLSSGAILVSMSINSPSYTGTQVGILNNISSNAGALVFDAVTGFPIKKSDGTFFTTEDLAITGIASSSHVKFGSIIIEAEAQSNIPAYSIVRFTDFNKVIVANNYLIDNGTYGIVDYEAATGNLVNVTLEGLIENLAWDWTTAGINAPLYVDINGYLTTSIPPTPIIVAAVVDKHTILLRPSSLFLNTSNDPATPTNPGSVKISVPAVNPLDPIVVGDNDPRFVSAYGHVSNVDVHLTSNENIFLDSLVSYSGGITVMKNDHTGITRTLQAPAAGFTITNSDATAGNPTFVLTNDLAAIEGLGAAGLAVRRAPDVWTTRSLVPPTNGLTITFPDAVDGNPTFALADDLAQVEALSTYGITARTLIDGWITRTLQAPAEGFTITHPDGSGGDPTFVLANDLLGLESLTGNGAAFRTTTGWQTHSLTVSGDGIAIANPGGELGAPTFSLNHDLAQIEGLTGIGFAVRTNNNPEIWTTRSITAASGQTTVTYPDGQAQDVIVGLPNIGTPVVAAFEKITTDVQGRVSATTAVTPTDITTALAYTPVNKAGDVMTGALILNADPSAALGAATKQYVDNLASGLDPKGSVTAATTVPITLANNQSIDNIPVTTGMRVLVKDQGDQTTNGIYDVQAANPWTRSVDAIPGTTLTGGAYVFVEQGDTYAESGWVLTTDDPITGASLLVFQQFSGAGQITAGVGLQKTGNNLHVITPTVGNITINGAGVDLTPTGIVPGTYKSLYVDTYGRITSATNPTTLGGYGIIDAQPLNTNLTDISAFSGVGFAVRNTGGTWSQRSITGTANQIVVTTGGGDGANPSLSLDSSYVQFPGTNATFVPIGTTAQAVTVLNGGLRYDSTTNNMRMVESGAWKDVGTIRNITFTDPLEGITHSGVLTNSTYAITTTLTGDLQALEALTSTGFVIRTGADTYRLGQIAGTAGRISVANGGGNIDPVIDLVATGVTANTYTKVTADIYGRITSAVVPGTPGANTLSDYGLSAVAQPLATNLTNLSTFNTNGIMCYTGSNSFNGRQLVSAAGTTVTNMSVTNPAGQGGDITLNFIGDLGPFLAAQTATGFPVRTGATAWSQRQIAGTTNRISITNPTGSFGDPTIDIDATYAGQATIATVGTITSGTWHGNPIAPVYGGTGISSNGTIDQFLTVSHTNATVWEYKTLNGTSNQVIVAQAAGVTTLSLPQSINTAADVVFNSVNAPIIKSAILTLTDAANISWNMALGINATVTLTASRTLDNPTNLQSGAIVVLKVVQDGAGAHTLAYGTAYKWVGGVGGTPVVAAGVNAVSILTFLCDGTNLYEMSRALDVA